MINVQVKSLQTTSKNNAPQKDASLKNLLQNRDEVNSFKNKLAQKVKGQGLKDNANDNKGISKAPKENEIPDNYDSSEVGTVENNTAISDKNKKPYEESDDAEIILMALMKLMQGTNDIEKLEDTGDLLNSEELPKINSLDGKTVEDLLQRLIRVLNKTQDDFLNDGKLKDKATSLLKDLTNLQSPDKASSLSDINKILEFLKSNAENLKTNSKISDDKGLVMENSGKDNRLSSVQSINNLQKLEDKSKKINANYIHQSAENTVNKDNSPKDKVVPLAVVNDMTTSGKKDESFLESLINEVDKKDTTSKIDSKINRAMNIMSTLGNVDKTVEVGEKIDLVVNKASVTDDVVKVVKYMEINNLKNLTVKVAPKELGEIVIKLTMEAGKMKLSLNAATKETFNLLNANVQELSSKLNSENIKIHPAEINVYNEDTTFFSNQFNDDKSSNHESEGKTSGSRTNGKDSILLEEDENISQNNIYDESSVNALA